MRCPHDGAALEPIAAGTQTLARCPTCRAVAGEREGVEWLIGGPLADRPAGVALAGLEAEGALACPRCDAKMESREAREAAGSEHHACGACGCLLVDEALLDALRARRRERSERAQKERAPDAPPREQPVWARRAIDPRGEARARAAAIGETTPDDEASPIETSLFAPGPLREAIALLVFFALALALAQGRLGSAIVFMAHIQFHELGHALVAWSTGRSALPLPFGFTPWSEQRSIFVVSTELLLVPLLALYGYRAKSSLALGLTAALGLALLVGLSSPLEAAEEVILLGGFVGEALLAALAALAFHARPPPRLRWDFFRWFVLAFAALVLATAVPDYLAIGRGDHPLPQGSFVSSQQSDGDIERLIRDHGWSEAELRRAFGDVGLAALLLGLAPHPFLLGLTWLRARRRRRPATSAPARASEPDETGSAR